MWRDKLLSLTLHRDYRLSTIRKKLAFKSVDANHFHYLSLTLSLLKFIYFEFIPFNLSWKQIWKNNMIPWIDANFLNSCKPKCQSSKLLLKSGQWYESGRNLYSTSWLVIFHSLSSSFLGDLLWLRRLERLALSLWNLHLLFHISIFLCSCLSIFSLWSFGWYRLLCYFLLLK